MACRSIPVPGGIAILCGPKQRVKPCSVPACGRPGAFLCDHPVTGRKTGTCDAALCVQHTTRVAFEKDLCGPHAKLEASRG
jgi:hypothetical protein